MTRNTQRTLTFLGLFSSLIICSFLVKDTTKTMFITFAVTFLCISGLSLISNWFKQKWFSGILESIDELRLGYFTAFLTIYSLSLKLIENNNVLMGQLLVLTDYGVFYYWVGRKLLGKDVLCTLCNRLNIFQPSSKIPDEFKGKGWGL